MKCPISLIFTDTMIRTEARAAREILLTVGSKQYRISNKTSAWIIPAKGVCAPVLTLAAVLTIAPVAEIPPKISETDSRYLEQSIRN